MHALKHLHISRLPTQFLRLILITLIFILRFPYVHETFSPGLDSPLIWIFNYLHHQKPFSFPDMAFPYGPMAFIMFPMFKNALHAALIHLVLIASMLFGIEKLIKKNHPESFLFVTFVFAFTASLLLTPLNLLLFNSLLYLYCWIKADYDARYFIFSFFWTVILFFVKISSGVTAFAFTYTAFLLVLFERKIKAGIYAFLISFLLYTLVGFTLYGSIVKPFHFFLSAVFVSAGNNDIALYNYDRCLLMLSPFVIIFLLQYLSDDNMKTKLSFLYLIPLFIEFKHGYTRKDTSHIHDLLMFFIVILLLYFITQSNKKNLLKWILGYLILFLTHANIHDTYNTENFSVYPFQSNILNIEKVYSNRDADVINHQIGFSYTDSITFNKLKGRSGDVFPWDQTLLLAHQMKWKPRPSLLMNNNAFCDSINTSFLLKDTPQYIILRKIPNFDGTQYSSIDDGYLFNQEAKFLNALLENYQTDTCLWDAVVMKKRLNSIKLNKDILTSKKILTYQYHKLPDLNDRQIFKIRIKPEIKFMSVLKSIFYKPDPVWIRILTKENITLTFRCSPYTLEQGIWINPLLYFNNIVLHPTRFSIQTNQFDAATTEIVRYFFEDTAFKKPDYFFSDRPYVKLKTIKTLRLKFTDSIDYYLSRSYRKDTLLIQNDYTNFSTRIKFDTLPAFYGFCYIRIPVSIPCIKHVKEIKIRMYKKLPNDKLIPEKEFSMANFYKKGVVIQHAQFLIHPWEIDPKSEYLFTITNLPNAFMNIQDAYLNLYHVVN